MMRPLEMRFRYHFDGDKPTNRIDKPEYFLSHIIKLVDDYEGFFSRYLQPILRDHFQGLELASNMLYIDSTSAMINALLPMLRRKIDSALPQIASQPQLLSHFVHELISFDATLREDWCYDGGSGGEDWKGITSEVLVTKEWFGRWLQVEKDCKLCLSVTSFGLTL
jgi:hypothetical protein